MATFKVGQRVRITRAGVPASEKPAYSEGVVVGEGGCGGFCSMGSAPFYEVEVPSVPCLSSRGWIVSHEYLAPLTDPGESTWAADAVRKVTKFHVEPVAPVKVSHE